jgi:hypothetical protein
MTHSRAKQHKPSTLPKELGPEKEKKKKNKAVDKTLDVWPGAPLLGAARSAKFCNGGSVGFVSFGPPKRSCFQNPCGSFPLFVCLIKGMNEALTVPVGCSRLHAARCCISLSVVGMNNKLCGSLFWFVSRRT